MNNEKKAPVLTLEHIAPYLPYGLKCHNMGNTDEEGHAFVSEIIGLDQDAVWVSHEYEDDDYAYSDTFPLLRPLSDLTKEIEHNGEKFVPWVEINKFLNGGKFQAHYNIIEYNEWDSLTIGFGDHCAGYSLNLESLPVIQMLLKWHFDLFELISQNLAIDINSIEGKDTKGNG